MADKTSIEWCDHTFNSWTGCTKVSPGCDNCYAESWARRSGLVKWGAGEERRRTSENYWRQPIKWNKRAARDGVRRRVFCASLADVFDNQAPEEWRMDLYALIGMTPHLDWLLLTKRPQNIAKFMPPTQGAPFFPNVWLGTTVENQEEADRRIPHLLAAPAAVRFLSCEPLLGPVQLHPSWLPCPKCRGRGWYLEQFSDNHRTACAECIRLSRAAGVTIERGQQATSGPRIDWVIAGGESGPNARPMHPDWARGLRDQCVAASVPFFFKQWGEWEAGDGDTAYGQQFYKVGKKKAGHLLDGVEWRQFPEPRP